MFYSRSSRNVFPECEVDLTVPAPSLLLAIGIIGIEYLIYISVDWGLIRICGQWSELLATDPEIRVLSLELPDFLRTSGFGTGPTEPREHN
jgi:hypothetical protein